jgi:hypothetical protein
MNKRAVFLFGAGAVLDWGAPKTVCSNDKYEVIHEHGSNEKSNRPCCLTHLITAIGFKGKDGERITNKIYEALKAKQTKKNEVNFETIINVIEELYTYWSSKKENNASLYSLYDFTQQIADLYFFQHTLPNIKTKRYSFSIPEYPFYNDDFVPENFHPLQKYYESFLNDLLSGIKGHVFKYGYYAKDYNMVFKEVNDSINTAFCKWMKKFVNNEYILRIYTLNYDRIFKVLLQDDPQSPKLNVFEGFDLTESAIDYDEKRPPNIPRIISDFDSHTHYNLHGCVDWEIEKYNINNLESYQYLLIPSGIIQNPTSTVEIEKGKRILLSNIITGYQKVQRTAISPFRQMLSAFDYDCYHADKLYIVGYSFGDEHINDIIRNARKYNDELEIILINPSFDDLDFHLKFLSHWGKPKKIPIYVEEIMGEIVSSDFNFKVFKKKFSEFLFTQ